MSELQTIPFETMNDGPTTLGAYDGQVRLVVNVASKCGLTPQYEALEQLQETYGGRGFTVLGFPANDFLEQEPGTDDEIAQFCRSTYGVTFPVFSKISVVGPDQHPLYAALTAAAPHAQGDPEAHRTRLREFDIDANEDPEILWNFEKFLIGRDGEVVARFAPNLTPDAPELVQALETALDA